MFWVSEGLVELGEPPIIALQIFFILGIDSSELSIKSRGEEERFNEELRETVQRSVQW